MNLIKIIQVFILFLLFILKKIEILNTKIRMLEGQLQEKENSLKKAAGNNYIESLK